MTDKSTDAVKDAKEAREEAVEAAADTAKDEQKRNEIDAQFREDVAKAAEKRDKALAKLSRKPGHGGNIAEIAWNDTKAEEDPPYNAITADHRHKLDVVVDAVRTTGNADVAGLELFEARVVELLAEEKAATGTVTPVAAAAKANAEKAGNK